MELWKVLLLFVIGGLIVFLTIGSLINWASPVAKSVTCPGFKLENVKLMPVDNGHGYRVINRDGTVAVISSAGCIVIY